MRKSWSSQFQPGNIGFPSISSPKMQPTAQRSISLPQGAPTSNYGGRYHLVATQSVSSSSPLFTALANPKSQILSSFLSLMSKFSGLMSLWSILRECMQASPLRSWQRRSLINSGSNPSGDFYSTSSKLFWTYQKTRQTIPFLRKAYLSQTMLGCCSIFSTFTSRIVVFFTIQSYSDSLNFFIATMSLLSLHLHFNTTPYAPSPIMPKMSYFCIYQQIKLSDSTPYKQNSQILQLPRISNKRSIF